MSSNVSDKLATSSQATQSTSKARRGKICLNKVAQRRVKEIIEDVQFNKLGQPVSKNAAELQSYIGLLTRRQVKVNIKTWRDVPADVKQEIWETVKSSCLESANNKWRSWKTHLYNEFIVPNKNDATKLYTPPPDTGILPVDWSQFVISRITEEFKKLSDKQKERRSKHQYPHRLSRKGYARLAEELKSELHDDEEVKRAIMWKKARVNKEGEVDDEKLKIPIQKIDEYIRKKEEGTLDADACSGDVLSYALDKPEHSGQIRALAVGVKPKSLYIGKSQGDEEKLNDYAKQKMDEQDRKILVQDKVIFELITRIGKLEAAVGEKLPNTEALGSCSAIAPSPTRVEVKDDDVIEMDKDELVQGTRVALVEKLEKVRAYGTMFVVGNVLHGAPMPANSFHVSIDEVLDEFATLLFPISDEIQTVGSALGTHVAWPNELVLERSLETKTPKTKKKAAKKLINESPIKKISSLPASLIALYYVLEKSFNNRQGLQMAVNIELFGDINIWIVEKDVIHFCNMEPITGNCILTYVWHLYRNMKKDEAARFLFVNPFTISHCKSLSIEDRARALSERLLVTTANQIVLAPCNVDSHWILTVIEPHKGRVYLLDSLYHRNRDILWKAAVDNAMSIFNAHNGKKFKNSVKWDIIKGPKQPGSTECGFFVMRYMKDIVEGFERDDNISLPSLFTNVAYSQVEIDEVREEWAKCVLLHVLD